MAFIKRCVSTVLKCSCGKPGIKNLNDKWYCLECSEKIKSDKKS